MAVTPHRVLPRDSHEISPTIRGGVHKLIILLRDLVKETIHKLFGEEMGGQGDPDPLIVKEDGLAVRKPHRQKSDHNLTSGLKILLDRERFSTQSRSRCKKYIFATKKVNSTQVFTYILKC